MTTDAEIVIGVRGEIEGGKRVQRTLDDIEKSGRQAKAGVKDLQSEFQRTDGTARLLANTMRVLGVSFGLRQLQQVVDTYTNIQNRLKLVTNNASELVGVTNELFQISNSTRQSFESTAEVYSRVALATKDMGLSQRDTLNFTQSLNQAVALSGASAAEASAGLIQLSQGLASGMLRGDELRSVLEQLPAVADVIAKGLGVTRGELRKMGEEGQITAQNVIQAFALAREELENNFGKTVPTIGQAFVVLKNQVIQFTGELDKTYGVSTKVAEAILLLGNNLDVLTKALFVAGGAWVIYRGYALLALGTAVLAAIAGNVAAFVQLAAGIRTAAGATALLNAAFMVGPGALFAVLGAVAGAAWVFRKELEASLIYVVTEAIIMIDKLVVKLQELADFGTTGLGAVFATAGAKMGLVDESALAEVLAEQGNKKKNYKNLSGFTAEQLRNEANDMIAGLGSGPSPSSQGTVSTATGVDRTPVAISEEQGKAQKQVQKLTESLKFQLEQLKRNDLEQEIYNNLKQAGVSIDTTAGQQIAELTRQYDENSKSLENQKRIFDTLADASSNFLKDTIKGVGSLGDRIKGLIADFADLAYQMAVIEPIKQNLFGGSGSSGGSGIFGALFSGIGSIFSSGPSASIAQAAARGAANPALYGPGFASGGSMVLGGKPGIDQNQLSLNGVPIAKTGRGEVLSISPKQKSGSGNIVVNQTINLSMGVAEAVAAQFSSIMPQLQRATQSAIEEAQMRGIKA